MSRAMSSRPRDPIPHDQDHNGQPDEHQDDDHGAEDSVRHTSGYASSLSRARYSVRSTSEQKTTRPGETGHYVEPIDLARPRTLYISNTIHTLTEAGALRRMTPHAWTPGASWPVRATYSTYEPR